MIGQSMWARLTAGRDVFSPARRRSASTKAHVVCSVIYIYINIYMFEACKDVCMGEWADGSVCIYI